MLLADVRCLPGCEGAPVVGACGGLLGVLAAPLAHRGFQAEARCLKPVAVWLGLAAECFCIKDRHQFGACWRSVPLTKDKHASATAACSCCLSAILMIWITEGGDTGLRDSLDQSQKRARHPATGRPCS